MPQSLQWCKFHTNRKGESLFTIPSVSCEGIKHVLAARECHLNNDFESEFDSEF